MKKLSKKQREQVEAGGTWKGPKKLAITEGEFAGLIAYPIAGFRSPDGEGVVAVVEGTEDAYMFNVDQVGKF